MRWPTSPRPSCSRSSQARKAIANIASKKDCQWFISPSNPAHNTLYRLYQKVVELREQAIQVKETQVMNKAITTTLRTLTTEEIETLAAVERPLLVLLPGDKLEATCELAKSGAITSTRKGRFGKMLPAPDYGGTTDKCQQDIDVKYRNDLGEIEPVEVKDECLTLSNKMNKEIGPEAERGRNEKSVAITTSRLRTFSSRATRSSRISRSLSSRALASTRSLSFHSASSVLATSRLPGSTIMNRRCARSASI